MESPAAAPVPDPRSPDPGSRPASEDHLRTMLRFALDGVWLVDADGVLLEVNEAACGMLGYPREELVGMAIDRIDANQSSAAVRSNITEVMRLGSKRFEAVHRRRDGSRLPVEVSAVFIPDRRQFVVFLRDISALREEREQADRWRRTFTHSSLPLAHVDHTADRFVQVNRAFAETRGYLPEEMEGMPVAQVVLPAKHADLAWLRAELEARDHVVYETINRRKDGSSFPTLVDVTLVRDPDGTPRARIAYAQDLTRLRRAEEATRKAGILLRTLLDTLPDLVWVKDPGGRYLECNARFTRFFGAGRERILGRTDHDFVDGAQADFFREYDLRVLESGRPSMNEEEITFRSDGHRECLETIKTPIAGPEGEVLGVLGIGRDITGRKAAEQALRASEERLSRELAALRETQDRLRVSEEMFHQAFHTAPVLASLSSLEDGRILEVNERYCQVLGFQRQELLGRTSVELGIFRGGERARLFNGLASSKTLHNLEAVAYAKDGRAVPCLFSAEKVNLGDRFLLLVMALDITERKQAEEMQRRLDHEMQQVQKLDSLGSLAGGVAHDMNNVLAAIQAVTETLKQRHGGDADLRQSLGLIEKASARGRDLVRGLTNFARKDLREAELLDLNALVQEEMELLSRTTRQRVNLVMELEAPLRPVLGERGSLAGVLMNLCVNAVDAMPAGGTLTLRTRNLAEDQVELEVTDSGHGMPPEVRARAMEPFFTTKPAGKGTGLGLSMAYSTAKAHGGSLAIWSESGSGTRVALRLPALPLETAAGPRPVPEPAGPGPRRILLVDDDELILDSVPSMIESRGHTVLVARSGPEGLSRLAADPPVDLVVLDLNMPGMNGAETLARIREGHPELPVILASGFLDDETGERLRGDRWTLILSKPYTLDQMLGKFLEAGALERRREPPG